MSYEEWWIEFQQKYPATAAEIRHIDTNDVVSIMTRSAYWAGKSAGMEALANEMRKCPTN